MKIALPLVDGRVSQHFGHSDRYALVKVDEETKKIEQIDLLVPPPHHPGVIPGWLSGQGAEVIIAASMGSRAQQLFAESSITVILGAKEDIPQRVVASYLDGTLKPGPNLCDH